MRETLIFKSLYLTLLLFLSYEMYSSSDAWFWFNHVNLIFHEAGHVLWYVFGEFMHTLGGSLTEILIPLIIALYFCFNRDWNGALFGFWWLATALRSVSIYISDATTQQLPLITGDPSTHDWTYLLGRLSLLDQDGEIGLMVLYASFVALAIGVILYGRHLYHELRRYQELLHITTPKIMR